MENKDFKFKSDQTQRRKEHLIDNIIMNLKSLSSSDLEDIHFMIENRKLFIGYDESGKEIYNFPQPGSDYPGSSNG